MTNQPACCMISSSSKGASNTQKNKRSEPGTDYNTIGKITDVRVVRYDILVSSRTKQAAQQIITQTDLSEKENRAHSTSIFLSATVGTLPYSYHGCKTWSVRTMKIE